MSIPNFLLRGDSLFANGDGLVFPITIQISRRDLFKYSADSLLEISARSLAFNLPLYQKEDFWLPPEVIPSVQRHLEPRLQKTYLRDQKTWYPSGNLATHTQYDPEGRKHGLCRKWYENGNIWLIENYHHGKLHGKTAWLHENGSFWTKQRFKLGKRHGKCRWWRPNGTLEKVCEYREGELEGAFATFHPNGTPNEQGVYHRGHQVGSWSKHSKKQDFA
ncbi:hypothetical protein QOT17_017523 [Balamuthia mandrillaris]